MRTTSIIIVAVGTVGSSCAGCGLLGDVDDNSRDERGSTHDPWDSGPGDVGGTFGGDDADGRFDVGRPEPDAEAPDSVDMSAAVDLTADAEPVDEGPTCGDGVVEGPETCDDGVTVDCLGSHDGGDGVCVGAGTCSAQFVFDGTVCVPAQITQHVHIYVANNCAMMVDPPELEVPRGQTVRFSWHNHSQSYPVDVWQSYIGGYTDLAPGMTWNEQFEWCFNVNPYVGYSDITTNSACPSHRFMIRCNGR